MIAPRVGTRVWLAAGITDMRCGIDSLAVKVQAVLREDPFSGHVFAFRGRRGDLLKVLWSDGDGMCLLTKDRLAASRTHLATPHGGVVHEPLVDGTCPVAGHVRDGHSRVMMIAELLADNAALSSEVKRSREALKIAQLTIDKMAVELAYLRRMKYGRSSERLDHSQLELIGGQFAQPPVVVPPADADSDPSADDGLASNVTSLDKARQKREA